MVAPCVTNGECPCVSTLVLCYWPCSWHGSRRLRQAALLLAHWHHRRSNRCSSMRSSSAAILARDTPAVGSRAQSGAARCQRYPAPTQAAVLAAPAAGDGSVAATTKTPCLPRPRRAQQAVVTPPQALVRPTQSVSADIASPTRKAAARVSRRTLRRKFARTPRRSSSATFAPTASRIAAAGHTANSRGS
jgi:hypothetical protein